ncbi:TRAP transporter substrate-binding protein [Granulosicoccus antarcticus]|uniref:Solute-binding protein n=1 Tax=Granulosicoccus antarcticus IMCC3135 TaxID=1192854 RepID=A0A2Z2NQK7_9GAMM|nr:TRAP transporter substrate-binding protein [Granulosicoccus antarcticus]ASJ73756.1 Solute-binding protein [Granulosicoccus antarcticus IMCC3135]
MPVHFTDKTLKPLVLGTVAFAAIWTSTVQADVLKLAHFMPPTHPMDVQVMTPMAEAYNEAVAGSSEIRIFPAGELGPGPKEQYKRVATGVADLTFILPEFTPDLFPVLTSYELPGQFADSISATQAMWENRAAIEAEVNRAVPLGFWANNATILITRDKIVRTPADLSGLKIRVAGRNMARVIEAWGGVPVDMSPTEAYQALSTGVVDGIYIGPTAFSSYKLYEVAKYATVNIPGSIYSFLLAMNTDAYAALSEGERKTLQSVSGEELSLKAAKAFADVGKSALGLAGENGVEMISLTDEEINVFAGLSPFSEEN